MPNTTLPGHSYFTLVNYVGNILFVGLLSDKLNVYSTDFGTTWKSTGPDEVAHSHVHYGGNYLSINHKGVWFSEHPGGPWRLRTEGIDVSSTRAILIDNEDVWVGTTSGLYKAVRSLNY